MDRSDLEAIAAAANFLFSLFQMMALAVIIAGFFKVSPNHYFYRLLQTVISPLLYPIRLIFRPKSPESDISPVVLLFISIPIQFILVHEIRSF